MKRPQRVPCRPGPTSGVLKTVADVTRWIGRDVEWADEASRDRASEAVNVLTLAFTPRSSDGLDQAADEACARTLAAARVYLGTPDNGTSCYDGQQRLLDAACDWARADRG